jgi:phage-related protein
MEIRYYKNDIEKFILSLDVQSGSDIDRLITLLRKCGNEIKMPYSKAIGGGLFELRKLGKRPIRVIYCFHNDEALILHIFEKKSNAILKHDLDIAKQRKSSLA